ncbi:MAG: alpha/beta hydrolase family protein [Bifidobacteriaceae bacterium]|jgi:hypothetical protein|nr:alpha/beta hydrolase family protein [Bifidobacteriaceae bacterium]
MAIRRWTCSALIVLGAILLAVNAQLNAWAWARDGLVRAGSSAAPTAWFTMPRDSDSLLAAGSDPRLRVTVDGDLATAKHIAVLVPGVDTNLAQFDQALGAGGEWAPASGSAQVAVSIPEPVPVPASDGAAGASASGGAAVWWRTMPGWARSLRLAAAESTSAGSAGVSGIAGAADVAVVAWLGYAPPTVWAGATADAMRQGASNLVAFDQFLRSARPDADVTWICHSYGSLVCASALVSADPEALILLGSPGVGVDQVAQLATDAPVWAGQTGQDLIWLTRLTGAFGGAFGELPSSDAFGARLLPGDSADGHSDYFRPGSSQVAAMASIILGHR